MSDWINEVVFYHIYTLGFCGAPEEHKREEEPINRIQKVEEWIPHLQEMGINAVYFGPLFESSSHGYDTKDYYHIDSRLGTNHDFKEVAEKLHEAGIKIVLDGVFNHVGREFGPFEDVKNYGKASHFKEWFNINFDSRSSYGDPFWYEGWEGYYNLVKLNLRNEEVISYLFDVIKSWIDEFDIDGLRLDVAYCLDQDFMRRLRTFTSSLKKDFWLMGEMIHGDYSRVIGPGLLHSATNYECYKGIYSSHNDSNYFEINYSMNRLFGSDGIYKDLRLYNFVDNHDVDRIASKLVCKEHLKNVYTLLFTMPGIPSIYYGSEWGVEGRKEKGSDQALRTSYGLEDFKENRELVVHISRLAKLKKEYEPLNNGLYEQIIVRNKQLVFARCYQNQKVYIALNLSKNNEKVSFKVEGGETLVDVLVNNYYNIEYGSVSIELPAFSSSVLVIAKKPVILDSSLEE